MKQTKAENESMSENNEEYFENTRVSSKDSNAIINKNKCEVESQQNACKNKKIEKGNNKNAFPEINSVVNNEIKNSVVNEIKNENTSNINKDDNENNNTVETKSTVKKVFSPITASENKANLKTDVENTNLDSNLQINVETNESRTSSCKTENAINDVSSPKSSPQKKSIENDLRTPDIKRRLRSYKSLSSEQTPSPKKRKISISSDYEIFSNSIKSEFADVEQISDYEAIELLHDIDNIINFEDCVIPSDILSSLGSEFTQETFDSMSDVNNEPTEDPLFISNNEVTDSFINKSIEKNVSYKNKARKLVKHYKHTKTTIKNKENETNLSMDEENDLMDTEEELSEAVILQLRNLQVELIHEVLPQHQIETQAGCRPLSIKQKKQFEKYGPLRKGTYSPTEDEIIKNNWLNFCKLHKWDPEHPAPFFYFRHKYKYYLKDLKNRQRFVQFLANGLPWRSLYSVYCRFKNLYHKRKSSRFSIEEDRTILDYINNSNSTDYAKLARKLNRSRRSVWSRCQILKKPKRVSSKKKKVKKVKCTLPFIEKFIKNLMKITLSENINELKDAIIPKVVWEKLEEKLEVDHDELKKCWLYQLHMQLFCEKPIYLNDIKIKLIEYMYGKGVSHTREIIWPNVAKYFNGVTTVFLCKTFFLMVKHSGMSVTEHNLAEIIEYLYNEKIPKIKNDVADKHLPRLKYQDEELTIVNEDFK